VFIALQCILKTFVKAKFSCHTGRRKTKSEESKVAIVAELADRGTQKIWSPINSALFYKILLLRSNVFELNLEDFLTVHFWKKSKKVKIFAVLFTTDYFA